MDRSPGSVCCPGTTAVGAGEGGGVARTAAGARAGVEILAVGRRGAGAGAGRGAAGTIGPATDFGRADGFIGDAAGTGPRGAGAGEAGGGDGAGAGPGGAGGGGAGGGLGGVAGALGAARLGGAVGAEDQVIHAATTANTPSNATAARTRPPMRLVAATGSWSASGITRGRHVGGLASSRTTSGVTRTPPPPRSSRATTKSSTLGNRSAVRVLMARRNACET